MNAAATKPAVPALVTPRDVSAGSLAWVAGLGTPLLLGAVAAGLAHEGSPPAPAATWIGLIVATAALVGAYTDARWQRLPNWLTYSAAVWGLGLNLTASLWPASAQWSDQWIGAVGIADSLAGFAALFVLMLVVFSFTGGGAGDVKLAGAIGALLGLERGVEAMLVGFLAAGVFVFVLAIVKAGPVRLVKLLTRRVAGAVVPGWVPAATADVSREAEQALFRMPVALGPFFAIGMLYALLVSAS